ncbi:MAG: hypothetical protein F4164_13485 [Gemmatimonadales bacterium]|nr:hypothetical protein [Gemmatimonadales bacterium]MYK01095.1 hypothetical protein [Candidatus Palauibacter ramosifaciens]
MAEKLAISPEYEPAGRLPRPRVAINPDAAVPPDGDSARSGETVDNGTILARHEIGDGAPVPSPRAASELQNARQLQKEYLAG